MVALHVHCMLFTVLGKHSWATKIQLHAACLVPGLDPGHRDVTLQGQEMSR